MDGSRLSHVVGNYLGFVDLFNLKVGKKVL